MLIYRGLFCQIYCFQKVVCSSTSALFPWDHVAVLVVVKLQQAGLGPQFTNIALTSSLMLLGTGYFNQGFYPTSMQEAMFRGRTTHPHDLHPIVKFFSLYMTQIERLYGNKFYAKGQNLVMELGRKYDAALEEFDVLVMPTLPYTATKIPPADCSFTGVCVCVCV